MPLQLAPGPDDDDEAIDEAIPFGAPTLEGEFVDCSTYDAIRKLWPDHGLRKDGKPADIDAVAKHRYGKPLDELSQEEAELMLGFLQARANEMVAA